MAPINTNIKKKMIWISSNGLIHDDQACAQKGTQGFYVDMPYVGTVTLISAAEEKKKLCKKCRPEA